MDLQKEITKLVQYGLDHELIQPEDKIYTINQYLEIFHLDEYEEPDISGEEIVLEDILKNLLDAAYDRYIIKSNDVVTRDLFDTRLMGVSGSKAKSDHKEFWEHYEESPRQQPISSINSVRIPIISEDTESKGYEMEG